MKALVLRLAAALPLAALPLPSIAQSFSEVARAITVRDWPAAEAAAGALDRLETQGDFFAAYVRAAQLVEAGRCPEALPVLDALVRLRPYFVPAHELAYLCAHRGGDTREAVGRLDAMLAVLPDGAERQLVAQLRANEMAQDRPAIQLHGSLVPTTNANRATSATHLPGSDWTIQERGTPGVLFSGGVSITSRLVSSPNLFIAGVVRADLDYSTAKGLLSPTLGVEVPMTFGSLDSTRFLATPFAAVGFEGLEHSVSRLGARGVVSVPISESLSLTLSALAGYAKYEKTPWRDGVELDAAFTVSALFGPATRLTTTLAVDYDHTFDETRRTLDVSALARLDQLMDNGLVVGVQGKVGARFHSAPAATLPPDAPNQRDGYLSGRLELAHRAFTVGPFMPVLHYQYTVQFSDNIFYAYDAHDIGLSLKAKL